MTGNAPHVSITSKLAQVTANAFIKFSVEGEVALQANFAGIDWAADVYTVNDLIYGAISASTMGTVSNFSSTLGWTKDQFQQEFQTNINTAVADANAQLKNGTNIPAVAGIKADLEVNIFDGYAQGGVDLTPELYAYIFNLKEEKVVEQPETDSDIVIIL